jgi:hypothetical protein
MVEKQPEVTNILELKGEIFKVAIIAMFKNFKEKFA